MLILEYSAPNPLSVGIIRHTNPMVLLPILQISERLIFHVEILVNLEKDRYGSGKVIIQDCL